MAHTWFPQVDTPSSLVEDALKAKLTEVVRDNAIDFQINRAEFEDEEEYEYAINDTVSTLSRYHQVGEVLTHYLGHDEFLEIVGEPNSI
jgi:hypothetical protein